MSGYFADFKSMEEMKTSLKKIENEVNNDEVEEIKRLVSKYVVILKGDTNEIGLIIKYKYLYDELNECVLNKRKEINDINKIITTLSVFSPDDNFTTIVNKKKDNVNQIIDCINRIVERIEQLETTIYNNKIKELNNMKLERYDIVKQQPIKQVQIHQPIKTNDNKMNNINNSMNVLKQWSNKNTLNVIFDSDIDGDGSNNVLYNKVFNKSNLYFISFDGDNNVYGGYLNNKINIYDDCVCDGKSFVFSLIRNGKVNNKRYFLKQDEDDLAFWLYNYNPDDWLYVFGDDIYVNKVGSNLSWCTDNEDCSYEYKNDNKPFTDVTYWDKFVIQRIVVIEMN